MEIKTNLVDVIEKVAPYIVVLGFILLFGIINYHYYLAMKLFLGGN